MVKIYFSLDEEGYLDGWGSTPSSEDCFCMEVPKDHEVLRNAIIFKFVDGELIKDEERQQELIDQHERESNKLSAVDLNTLALFELAQEIEALRIENKKLKEER